MFSKFLSGLAIATRLLGYGAIVCISLKNAAAETLCYVMIFASEVLHLIALMACSVTELGSSPDESDGMSQH
jgi:hypothetical protein